MMNIFINFSYFSIFLCYINCVILETKQGTLEGEISSSRDGRPYYAFYSIPYAEPPVGNLRFQSPVPTKLWKSWSGIRDATVLPPPCLSLKTKVIGQEDCLYLNVYTPKLNNSALLPVMVFIHGGRFMYHNALPSRYGPQYFMDEDVVLITFHYRLGVLGFLSTEDEVIPGNYALKDAIAVLQWVQKYIDAYGGDKNRVTVFGSSSGSTSASLLLMSPLAQGLVHRVISQSDHNQILELTKTPKRNAWQFASFVGCDDKNNITTSEALLKCLRKLPAEELTKHQTKIFSLGHVLPYFPWTPVIENEKVPGAFLVDDPSKLLGRKSDIPWIIGLNSADGGLMAIRTYFNGGPSVTKEFAKNYKKYMPIIFHYDGNDKTSEQVDQLTEIYKNFYFRNISIRENVQGFAKMHTCLIYFAGLKKSVSLYQGKNYVYYYDHRNKNVNSTLMYSKGKFDDVTWVNHGDELISMYNKSEVIKPITEGIDLVVSKRIVKLWVNFAATGDPNNKGEQLWRPVDSPDINYLHIKNGTFKTNEALLKSECKILENVPVKG